MKTAPRLYHLSKSKFMLGDHCLTHLWHDTHSRNLAQPMSFYLEYIVLTGSRFGEFARTLYPEGLLIEANHQQIPEALAATQAALASGATTLFEPAFIFQETLIRADILQLTPDGWVLTEVKSAKPNTFHYLDLAVQTWVIENSGIPLTRMEVLHPNFTSSRGHHIVHKITDVTSEVRSLLPEVTSRIQEFLSILSQPQAPTPDLGPHCFKAYLCPFEHLCWPSSEGPSIFSIPHLNASRARQMLALGMRFMSDIPRNYDLSPPQREIADLYAKPGLTSLPPALQDFLSQLTPRSLVLYPGLAFQLLPTQAEDNSLQNIPFGLGWSSLSEDLGHSFLLPPGSRDRSQLANLTGVLLSEVDSLVVWQSKDAVSWLRAMNLTPLLKTLKILELKPLFEKRFLFDPRWKDITLDSISSTLAPDFPTLQIFADPEDAAGLWLTSKSPDRRLDLHFRRVAEQLRAILTQIQIISQGALSWKEQ